MQLPENYTNLLKSTLFDGLKKIDSMKWGLIIMGVVLVIGGMGGVMCFHWKVLHCYLALLFKKLQRNAYVKRFSLF